MTGFATCLVLLVLLGVGRATLLCDSRADATALVAATLASAADTRFLLRQAAPLVLVDHAALATLLTDKLHLLLAAPSGGVASVAASSDDVRVLYRPTAWASTAPLAYAPGSGNCTALGATLLADELPLELERVLNALNVWAAVLANDGQCVSSNEVRVFTSSGDDELACADGHECIGEAAVTDSLGTAVYTLFIIVACLIALGGSVAVPLALRHVYSVNLVKH